MKVILLQNLDSVGYKHDVINVKPGYGRNFLIPQGYAVIANPSNQEKLNKILDDLAATENAKLDEYKAMAAKISGKSVSIGVKSGTSGKIFGKVTNVQVAAMLKESFDIEMSSDDEEGEAITHDNMPLSLSKDSVVRSNVQNNVRDSPSEIDTNNSDLPVNDSNLVQTPHLNNNSELTIDEPYLVNNPEANINTDATVEEPILVHKTKMGKSFIQLSRRHKEKSVNTKVSLKDLFEQKRSTRSAPNPKFYSFDMEKPFKYVK